jgi:hypothetical protein
MIAAMAHDPVTRRHPVETRPSPLDDPDRAARAWAHFRRMMRWTAELALGVVAAVWVLLYHEFGMVSIHLYIASALGIGLMIVLLGALMGLVFVSHASGHDDAIVDPLQDDPWRRD